MGRKGRYRPVTPPAIEYSRIDVGQKAYLGPWFVFLTEPWPERDRPWGQVSEMGPYPSSEEAHVQAVQLAEEKGVEARHLFVSGPIHSFIPYSVHPYVAQFVGPVAPEDVTPPKPAP